MSVAAAEQRNAKGPLVGGPLPSSTEFFLVSSTQVWH
jgi:hypothetical protein